jgi:hypothetical protein
MAPKKSTAAAKAAAQPVQTPAAAPTTLLERSEGPAASRKKRAGRTVEQIVQKILTDNFKGFSAVQTDCTVRNTRTLRERLTWDKEQNITMGKTYYMCRRLEYEDDESPSKK